MKLEIDGHEVEITFDEDDYPTIEITLNGCLGQHDYPMAAVILNGVSIHEMTPPEHVADTRWKS